MNGPFCLVVNPRRRRPGRAAARAATAALAEAGAAFQSSARRAWTTPGSSRAQRPSAGDVVIAVGGDGLAGALAGAVSAAGGSYGIIRPGAATTSPRCSTAC